MKNIKNDELDNIKGGQVESVSGPIINAVVGVIKVLQDAGYSMGSGIRRLVDNNICPLD